MAELKDLLPLTKNMSLLYVDEDQELLSRFTSLLKKVFTNVDDASNATIALGYLKVNSYDIIIVDTSSSITDPSTFVENILKTNAHQEIILTTRLHQTEELLSLYKLKVHTLLEKPFKASALLHSLFELASKISFHRAHLEPKIEKLSQELLYERKRIGRFMLNEKKLEKMLKEYAENLKINKNIYELTRLPSKYALQSDLDGTFQSLLYINIDHFDFINTIYGMGKANKLLKACAVQLRLFLPTNAKLYHITADEFVILLDEPSQTQEKQLAQQIQALFKESALEFDAYSHFIVFSIGIASGEGKRLFINAKAASKEARFYGGNSIVTYNQNSQYMKEQKESLYWINVLKKALEDDRIINYYQAIVSNQDNKTKHYEVLCRLLDTEGQLIDAKHFIESAKLVGLASQITKIVIDKAFKLFTNNEHSFSINISMYDLHEDYLSEFLNYKCKRYNVDSSRVYLEIVEDILMSKTETIDKQIQKLKTNGYSVIIDDFSSEKSAYSRMFELEAQYIKIDGSFIKELDKNSAYQLVVKSIVDFAQKSNIKTIAEHVENSAVSEIVKELGVDYSQGYFLAKPSLTLQ